MKSDSRRLTTKPDNLLKNSTAEPLKGDVNVCVLDPPATEAPITVAPVEILNHSTLKLDPDLAERLIVKLPPFGAKARYYFSRCCCSLDLAPRQRGVRKAPTVR